MVKLQGKKKLESQFLEQKPSLMISYTEDKRLEMDFDALRENLWFTDSVVPNSVTYICIYSAAISSCEKSDEWPLLSCKELRFTVFSIDFKAFQGLPPPFPPDFPPKVSPARAQQIPKTSLP